MRSNGKSQRAVAHPLEIANVTDVLGERVGWEEELIGAAEYALTLKQSQPDFRAEMTLGVSFEIDDSKQSYIVKELLTPRLGRLGRYPPSNGSHYYK